MSYLYVLFFALLQKTKTKKTVPAIFLHHLIKKNKNKHKNYYS